MNELLSSVWVSNKASIDDSVIFGRNIVVYGQTKILKGSVIEDNVVIGHPSPDEIRRNAVTTNARELYDVYDASSKSVTVVGEKSIIRSNCVIYSGCSIGKHFDCGHNVIMRENCVIGNNCYLFVGSQLKAGVTLGQNCRVAGTLCDGTSVGDFVSMLGHTVHAYHAGVAGITEAAPNIGNGVVVGREAVIIGRVEIGDFAYIATNSVVLESVEEHFLVAGIPARKIRERDYGEYSQLVELLTSE